LTLPHIISRVAAASAAVAAMGLLFSGVQSGLAPVGGSSLESPLHAAEQAVVIPAPKVDAPAKTKRAAAIFAGGCFWGVEGVFAHTKGVISVESGYHGGTSAQANYDLVSAGLTSHAEAVRVVYDPTQISYGRLLQIYFSVIVDPTLLNRQGPDVGAHYRTALVPLNAAQGKTARAYLKQLEAGKYWSRPIVTKIEAAQRFYPAEAYHQDFMIKNPSHGYILRWDKPKVANFKRLYPALYRAKPVS
jgi:peptide-methionine (S)-S-oxide reductase